MMIDCEKIKKLALENGFKLKEQASGNLDLNSYVYEFAEALLKDQQAEIDLLKSQLGQSKATLDVVAERQRQISAENYTPDQDDAYTQNELTRAAEGYIHTVVSRGWTYESSPNDYECEEIPPFWPWADEYWKPKSPRRDLVRAAALLIAEIERIDRANDRKDV